MQYNYLLLDIDGTIVGRKDSSVGHDLRLNSKLHQYMENGGNIGLVTGRSSVYASAIYELFGLNGPRIVEMGAVIIMQDNRIISLNELTQKDEIKLLLHQLGTYKIMKEEPKEFMISLLLPEFPYHNPKKLEEIHKGLEPKIKGDFQNVVVKYDGHSIDIHNPNVDKGEAIKRYAQEMGLSLEDFAIVGDSRNDFPGFKVIGESGGFVGYVGFDWEVSQDVRKFKNHYVSSQKRSNGLVEIMNEILLK